MTLNELAEKLAEAETGESPPPRNIRKSVYSSLHQSHLPKLDSANIVHYDTRTKDVSLGPRARDVDPYMEVMTRYGVTWEAYYRYLVQLVLTTILLSELNVWVFSSLTSVILGMFLAVVAVSMTYQFWSDRWRFLRCLN